MTTQQLHATGVPPDADTIDRLSTGLNRCFETLDDVDHVLADDVFADLLPPMWRFQLQGRDQLVAQMRAIAEGEIRSRIVRVIPTATGFVLEHEETVEGDHREVARKLWLCEVRDGRISEVTAYCNGGWDDELRARHAAEAPMLRP